MNPILALIIANIIWGGASPIFKFSLTNIPPFTLAFIRFFFAALIFFPFFAGKWQKLTFSLIFRIFLSSIGIIINITFFFLGLEKTTSINAPIIASSGPVFIFILSVLFLKEKARLRVFTGMIISLIGVALIILSPIFLDGKTWVLGQIEGNLFFVIATFGAVLHTLLNKNIVQKVNNSQLTFIQFSFVSLAFLPLMLRELYNWSFTQLNINGWTGIIFGVIFSSAAAFYLFNYAMRQINAQEVGIFTYIDPLAAILIAVPLLQEYPSIYFFIGSLLVFSGIFLAERRIHWHPIHWWHKFAKI